MRKFFLTLMLAFAVTVSGCANLTKIEQGVQTIYQKVQIYYKGAPKTVYAARGGYDIALAAAVQFKETQCPAITTHKFCATVIPQLRAADAKAKVAFDTAETFVRNNPNLDASALITAAKNAALAFAAVETNNGVGAAQ